MDPIYPNICSAGKLPKYSPQTQGRIIAGFDLKRNLYTIYDCFMRCLVRTDSAATFELQLKPVATVVVIGSVRAVIEPADTI